MKKIILIALLGTFLLNACSDKDEKADAYGNFEAIEVIVSSQGNGQLLELSVNEGEKLEEGLDVGLIDTVSLSLKKKLLKQQKITIASQYDNVSSEISVLKQQKTNARTNQKRVHSLFKEGAATQKQIDEVDGLVNLIDKQIDAANTKRKNISDQIDGVKVQIEQVDDAINKCRIVNPVQGTVLVKYAENGEITGVGKPLYKIADLNELKLKAYVSGNQLADFVIGQQVEVQYDKSKKENNSVTGIVTWVSPSAEFTPKTIQTKEERVNLVYAIKVTVVNNGAIKIGMPGEIYFNK